MSVIRVTSVLLLLCCFLFSCTKQSRKQGEVATPTPTPNPVLTAAEAKAATASANAFANALERRWPLEAIRTYCIPERRHNNVYQNLVAYSPRWDGTLYPGRVTGFDEITWYASLSDGHFDQYSLNVTRGHDYWNLELGDEKALTVKPDYSPDPNLPMFIGHQCPDHLIRC